MHHGDSAYRVENVIHAYAVRMKYLCECVRGTNTFLPLMTLC